MEIVRNKKMVIVVDVVLKVGEKYCKSQILECNMSQYWAKLDQNIGNFLLNVKLTTFSKKVPICWLYKGVTCLFKIGVDGWVSGWGLG